MPLPRRVRPLPRIAIHSTRCDGPPHHPLSPCARPAAALGTRHRRHESAHVAAQRPPQRPPRVVRCQLGSHRRPARRRAQHLSQHRGRPGRAHQRRAWRPKVEGRLGRIGGGRRWGMGVDLAQRSIPRRTHSSRLCLEERAGGGSAQCIRRGRPGRTRACRRQHNRHCDHHHHRERTFTNRSQASQPIHSGSERRRRHAGRARCPVQRDCTRGGGRQGGSCGLGRRARSRGGPAKGTTPPRSPSRPSCPGRASTSRG
ncbi:MAG: hypothetical protein RJA98_1778 [Pseudomonadota bacterium]